MDATTPAKTYRTLIVQENGGRWSLEVWWYSSWPRQWQRLGIREMDPALWQYFATREAAEVFTASADCQ